jgi:hypothetical protein
MTTFSGDLNRINAGMSNKPEIIVVISGMILSRGMAVKSNGILAKIGLGENIY